VDARVVEEREWVDGVLVEVSRNLFAICDKTNDVFILERRSISSIRMEQ